MEQELNKIKNRNGCFEANIMFRISQLCKTAADSHRAMRHCMEIIHTRNYMICMRDVAAILKYDGILNTFEVSVDGTHPNRGRILAKMMKKEMKVFGVVNAILINFFVDYNFKMGEIHALYDILKNLDAYVMFGFSTYERYDGPMLRATVLVMHEN